MLAKKKAILFNTPFQLHTNNVYLIRIAPNTITKSSKHNSRRFSDIYFTPTKPEQIFSMGKGGRGSTNHHCPHSNKGCRPIKTVQQRDWRVYHLCKTHEKFCVEHLEVYWIMSGCRQCNTANKMDQKRANAAGDTIDEEE